MNVVFKVLEICSVHGNKCSILIIQIFFAFNSLINREIGRAREVGDFLEIQGAWNKRGGWRISVIITRY